MENDTAKIYDKLIEIASTTGQLKSDIEAVKGNLEVIKTDIQANYVSSEEADRQADAKLEKYYQQAKDRQDSIRDSLIKIIAEDQQRIKVLEDWKKDTGNHEERIKALEEWKGEASGKISRSIIYWLAKARDYIIWAAILALLASGFAYFKALFNSLHMPPEKPAVTIPAGAV